MTLHTPAELTVSVWSKVNSALLAKAIGEFSYEELLQPESLGGDRWRIVLPPARYEFRARRGSYDSWFVEPTSIRRYSEDGVHRTGDALRFIADVQPALGLPGDTTGHLVKELTATLRADARLAETAPTAAELAELPYAEVEGHQTGHPWIVPNKGRVGFSATDTSIFAPEARVPIELPWIAVARDLAEFRSTPDLDEQRLYGDELDEATRHAFAAKADPEKYLWMPVHPWQWDQVVVPLFAADVADGRIVALDGGPLDNYLPQQSIRTFSNINSPQRYSVKLPLSILNTLVWRGLPTERTVAAPAVTDWVRGLRDADPYLAEEARPVLLGEVASVTVRHGLLEDLDGVPYQYRELLGVIWRESLAGKLDPGERARTLASLLYVDSTGRAFVEELVARSGLAPIDWLQRLFGALIPPLLHFLYRYGVVFSPHGENAIVVFDENDAPTRLAIKDFVDDVNISAHPIEELADLPPDVAKVLLREPPDFLCQFIHSALFVGHFRYLAELSRRIFAVREEQFWALVREQILGYQSQLGKDRVLRERFGVFDLLTPRIERLCLNRNRLLLDGYRDRPERPHAAVHGTVPNPLYSQE